MKTGIFLTAALLQVAAAQPHRHNHAAVHEKRQVYVTDVSYATVTAAGPDVVVYVNAEGQPVTTSTINAGAGAPTVAPNNPATAVAVSVATSAAPQSQAPASSAAAAPPPASASSSEAPPPAPAASSSAAAAPAPAPAASSSSSAAPAQPSSSDSQSSTTSTSSGALSALSGSGLSGTGIVYSPYTAAGLCKTQDQVNTDFAQLGPKGYGLIRIYGTDCDQVSTVGSAVRQYGMKLFAGVFSLSDLASELQIIISSSNGDMSYIDTISIGNELVNSGEASAAQVVAAIAQARGILGAAGYTGSIVTVDTVNAVTDNPSLCQNSDYAAVNAHPFFDPTLLPELAGTWSLAQQAAIALLCGKKAVITETGMPWGGQCDGSMCPSYADQQTVVQSLLSAHPDGGIILLSAYNDLWKQNNAYTFDAEQNWGIYGDCPSSQ